MAQLKKLGKRTSVRVSLVKSQASDLLWFGKVETTLARAKSVSAYAEKLITLAVNTYEDNVKKIKEVTDSKGVKSQKEVIVDGADKLAARRTMLAKLNDLQEVKAPKETNAQFKERTKGIKHPICEKLFNLYAPKYAKIKQETNQGGGYTRIIRKYIRRGDNAEMVEISLI